MKYLFLILITIFLIGCDPDKAVTEFIDNPVITVDDHPIVGSWFKDNRVWHFYSNDNFLYCVHPDNTVINDGIYEITDNSIYIEDSYTGDSQTYLFEIVDNNLLIMNSSEYVRIIE